MVGRVAGQVKRATTDPLDPASETTKHCEPCGTRTHDPLIKSQVLYHLS